ncbi:DUF4234 domain-containing protein [Colwellia sp. RE-S-Sl-9]
MSDTEITPETENAFEAPKADLSTPSTDKPILQMKRFSAWGVFGLSIITFGIYLIYWMFTRVNKINTLSKVAKANVIGMYIYIAASIFSNVVLYGFTLVNVSLALSLISLVAFYVAIYSLRSAITEVINEGTKEKVKIGPIKTFFFNILYFQYKINEAIDNQRE